MSTSPIVLYGIKMSGHVHRVECMLHLLGLPFEYVQAGAEARTEPAFSKLNPMRQIPVLQDGELTLTDSNAILVYLVQRYAPDSNWLSQDAAASAAVQRWLSLAAGELAFGPAAARAAALFKVPHDVPRAHAIAQRLFDFMEQHLHTRTYLAAAHPTIADIAMYAYTARAPEGGISLAPFPAIRAWLERIEALPGFVPMPRAQP